MLGCNHQINFYFRKKKKLSIIHLPPETGASRKTAPRFSAIIERSFETEGSIVLLSTKSVPGLTNL